MIYLIIWVVCIIVSAAIYQGKGGSPVTGGLIGALLGPIGVVLALVTKPNPVAIEQQQLAAGQAKKCPHCGEMIRPEATICRFCHQPVEAIELPSNVARVVPNGAGGFVCSACNGGVRSDATTCKHCQKPLITSAATYAALGAERKE
jgi:predicted amidophosphoribosyltransferase